MIEKTLHLLTKWKAFGPIAVLKAMFFLLFIFPSFTVKATDYKEYLFFHHANMCNNYFEYFEDKYNIPKHLLRSISVVESGRWHNKAQTFLPWPWAVNQAGKAYYFTTKSEAIDAVKKMLSKGLTNIDVGCMQINLYHHPSAFYNLNEAFEPQNNIAYAAVFLNSHYKQSNNWQTAVASYHSQTQAGNNYAAKVFKIHSNYQDNQLALQHCSSTKGEIIPCKTATKTTTNSKIYTSDYKETLPLTAREIKLAYMLSNKSAKRLRSAMILYSTNSESEN